MHTSKWEPLIWKSAGAPGVKRTRTGMAMSHGGQHRSRPTASLEADVITKDVVRLSVDMRHLPHKGEDRLLPLAELRLHGANSELDHRIVPSRYSPELREQVLGSTDSRLGLAGEDELLTRLLVLQR